MTKEQVDVLHQLIQEISANSDSDSFYTPRMPRGYKFVVKKIKHDKTLV